MKKEEEVFSYHVTGNHFHDKMIKNDKKKRCFLFSYVYITSLHV